MISQGDRCLNMCIGNVYKQLGLKWWSRKQLGKAVAVQIELLL